MGATVQRKRETCSIIWLTAPEHKGQAMHKLVYPQDEHTTQNIDDQPEYKRPAGYSTRGMMCVEKIHGNIQADKEDRANYEQKQTPYGEPIHTFGGQQFQFALLLYASLIK